MDAWLAQHFLNPAIVTGGAILMASPIIIHLINRMRFRRVRFAAMEFLLESQESNRRRVLFEQLLLLLLRILIVVGLIALLARLMLNPDELSIFRGAQSHHLVLLDDSGSMRDRWGDRTAFGEAIDVVNRIAQEGSRRPGTQKFSLLLMSRPDVPLITARTVDDSFVAELRTRLENLECTYGSVDSEQALEAAEKLLSEDRAVTRTLHVISDFRKGDWLDRRSIATRIQALDTADIAVNLVRAVPRQHENLAVTQLSGALHIAAAGVPVRFVVGVKNFGEKPAENVRAAVSVDGSTLPLSVSFDEIKPGEEVLREIDIVFDVPRNYRVRVSLPGDALAHDNVRYAAVSVRGTNEVLVIDGRPGAGESYYVRNALGANPATTGYTVRVDNVEYLRRYSLSGFRTIYLLNVPELPPDAVEPLTRYVSEGGGLVWFLGDSIQPGFYNSTLYRQDGRGLFPVRLGPAPETLPQRDADSVAADLVPANHAAFQVFQGQDNPLIESVRVHRWFPVSREWETDDDRRADGVRTIARLRNGSPLMFEHRLGEGRIVTCLTAAGRNRTASGSDWNNWYTNPSWLIVLMDLQKHVARPEAQSSQRLVGEPIVLTLDPAEWTDRVEIRSPDALVTSGNDADGERVTPYIAERERTDGGSESAGQPRALVVRHTETVVPGFYGATLTDSGDALHETLFAYNCPLEESDLALASAADLRKAIGADRAVAIQEYGQFDWIRGRESGQELRDILLVALVCLLLAEQWLAYRLSYHPTPAGATA